MKKLMALLLLVSLLLPCARAWEPEYENVYYGTAPHTDGINNNVEDQAKMLHDLGLLKGRGEGDFALQSPMTREEAAVMLVRFLGAEEEALSGKFAHPFTDVAPWAAPYVGWLYQNKLTKGVGNGKYGTGNVTMWQYSTFLSRAVYGNEDNPVATEAEIAESEKSGAFLREAAVALSVRALIAYYWRDTTFGYLTTAGWLCRKGVFTAQQLDAAARGVLPTALYDENGILKRRVALVDVAVCPEEGFVPVGSYTGVPESRVLAYKQTGGTLTLAELDFATLSVKASVQLPGAENLLRLEYMATAGGADYFMEHLDTNGSGTKCGALLKWDGEAISAVKTAEELWKGQHVYPGQFGLLSEETIIKGGAAAGIPAVLCAEDRLLTLGDELREIPVPAGSKALGWNGKLAVLQCVTAESTTVFSVNLQTGAVVDSYTVAHDGEGEAYRRTVQENYAPGYGYYHGEAGLYKLEGEHLLQLTDLPAPVVTERRVGAGGSFVLLSHDLGKRCYGDRTGPTGDKIYLQEADGTFRLHFEVKPEWNLHLDTLSCEGSVVHLHSAQSAGMQHFDSFTYALLDGKLLVVDYAAGRPEMMTQTREEYMAQEQQRLQALGV